MIPPELLTNHYNRLALRTVFAGQEASPEQWRHTESSEEIGTHAHAWNCFRRAKPTQSKTAPGCEDRNMLKALLLITPRQKVRHAKGMDTGYAALMQANSYQSLGLWIRQRTE